MDEMSDARTLGGGAGAMEEWSLDLDGGVTMQLVLIPAGEFMMGSPVPEADHRSSETQHRVRITKPFYMGKYEVTQAQYERVMGKNPSHFRGSDLPVEQVSWNDATEFCLRLLQRTGRKVRLPTEAEWEYACRAGTTTPFHYGGSLSSAQADFRGTHPDGGAPEGVYRQRTTPVGSFEPNAWGLHDMHGNVWEWCSDWYHRDYYGKSPEQDPTGPANGGFRVVRGGGWDSPGFRCRSGNRCTSAPSDPGPKLGFRVVASPSPGR